MTTRVRLTYEDYAALPDDGRRYELHEGELSVTPAPGLSHQATLGNLFVILSGHVNARGLGELFFAPVDCIVEDITVVQPDLVFIETAHDRS
jgi:Uma2 family endonuclease